MENCELTITFGTEKYCPFVVSDDAPVLPTCVNDAPLDPVHDPFGNGAGETPPVDRFPKLPEMSVRKVAGLNEKKPFRFESKL